MTLSPEIIIALSAAVISVLGAIAAIGKFVPQLVKRHFDILQAAQSKDLELRQRQLEAQLEKQHADSQLQLAMAENLKLLTNELTATRSEQAANTAAIKANTAAITSVTEAQTDVVKRFDALLDTGSRPVQIIRDNTDQILKNSTEIMNAIHNLSTQQVSSSDFNTGMTEIRLAISALQGAVESAVKRKTQPIPMLTPVITNEADVNQ